jgi:signal transduction histidine kinase
MKSFNETEKNAVQIVAHELKTPLATMGGFLNLVQHVGELNELQTVYLGRAVSLLERMHNLIESIQNWIQMLDGTSITLKETNLNEIIIDTVDMLQGIAEPQHITLEADLEEDTLYLVNAHAELLSHVIINLLSNAIKYNHPEGHVWIRVRKGDGEVQVDVEDTGIGIPTKYHNKVFDQFFRATHKNATGQRIEGTGLGLAISKQIIEIHGGRMWLTSTPGKGSIFSFSLPI